MWRPPSEFTPKPFKVNEVQACTPCSHDKVQVHRETLLEDFKLLLKDFYLRIATPEELKREQREHTQPKRYFNNPKEREAEQNSPKPKKQKIQASAKTTPKLKKQKLQAPVSLEPAKKKRSNKTSILSASA